MRKLIDNNAKKRIIKEYLRVLGEYESEIKYPSEYDVFKEVARRCCFHFMRVSKVINSNAKIKGDEFDFKVIAKLEIKKIKNKALRDLKND